MVSENKTSVYYEYIKTTVSNKVVEASSCEERKSELMEEQMELEAAKDLKVGWKFTLQQENDLKYTA